MAAFPEPDRPFERLGDYDVLAPISQGGMATVWLGHPRGRPGELVAIKVIRPEHARNKEFVAMLVDEAAIAARLSHPNVPKSRGLGQDGSHHFLVMELLRGHTLLDMWQTAHSRGEKLPRDVVAWIAARVADAMHYAHELADDAGAPMNVVHRDVNPANVFVTSEGVPKLIDFGLAKARDRIASTAIGVVKGKLAYLAPEQAHGKPVDRRGDVFALGVTLWEITLDKRLFHQESDVETVRRVREAEVPDPATVDEGYPPALARAVVRALAREPEQRWQTAAELRDALDAYVASSGAKVDEAAVRALLAHLYANAKPAAWEKLADELTADQAKTRVWDERKAAEAAEVAEVAEAAEAAEAVDAPEAPAEPRPAAPKAVDRKDTLPLPTVALRSQPPPHGTEGSGRYRPELSPALLGVASVCALVGAVIGGMSVRGCKGGGDAAAVDGRLARIEDLLGLSDAGGAAAPAGSAAAAAPVGSVPSADDSSGACAIAKVAAYQAWQEAVAHARTLAQPAEAACAEHWSDSKKQACFRGATAAIRAAQAARDAVIGGGPAAQDAVRAVRDDPKNDAISRARAASQAAFTACAEGEEPRK